MKRRLVEVAIVARGDVFPNFYSFQEVLLKVQPHYHRLPRLLLFISLFLFQSGGVIELMPENVVGCPAANVFVHPSGHVELRSTFDSLRRFFIFIACPCFTSAFRDFVVAVKRSRHWESRAPKAPRNMQRWRRYTCVCTLVYVYSFLQRSGFHYRIIYYKLASLYVGSVLTDFYQAAMAVGKQISQRGAFGFSTIQVRWHDCNSTIMPHTEHPLVAMLML